MKVKAEIDDRTLDADVRAGDGRVTAVVDGRSYDLEYSEPEPGVYLFKHEGRIFEAATGRSGPDQPIAVSVRGAEFRINITDPRKLRGTAAEAGSIDGSAVIKTAMPGKVVRVLAAAGDSVEKGQGVVVVEAMKMQNELKSPKAGTVREIPVSEGQTVSAGDVLAVIE